MNARAGPATYIVRIARLVLLSLTLMWWCACAPAPGTQSNRDLDRASREIAAVTREIAALKRDLTATQQQVSALTQENESLRARIVSLDASRAADQRVAGYPASFGSPSHGESGRDPVPAAIAASPAAPADPAERAATSVPQEANSPAPSTPTTVYVTASGSKYHTAACRYAGSARPVSLAEVVQRNEPCKVCRPPGPDGPTTGGVQPTQLAETPDTVPKSTPAGAGGRCVATTQKGTRCKRSASAGSAYCWQHGN